MAVRRSAIGVPFKMYPSKPTARLFALAGAVYLAGAVGFEIVGNSLVGQRLRDTLEYNLWTLAEESLEMLGLILFLHTLLRYMHGPGANTVHVPLELT